MTIVFVVEEYSKQEFLSGLLPRLGIPDGANVYFAVAEGHVNIRNVIRKATRSWRVPNTHFLVLCDQDSADCVQRKQELETPVPASRMHHVTIRIVCTELEGWYLTDKDALAAALPSVSRRGRWPRELLGPPDDIRMPALRLARLAAFRKRDLAREMGRRISLEPGASHSFNLFLRTLRRILADAHAHPDIDHPPHPR